METPRAGRRRGAEEQTQYEWNQWPAVMKSAGPVVLGNIDTEGGGIAGHVRGEDVIQNEPAYDVDKGGGP